MAPEKNSSVKQMKKSDTVDHRKIRLKITILPE